MDIPKNGELIQLDSVRIERNAGKVCRCGENKKVLINPFSKQVYCNYCGALLDAFQTLHEIAIHQEKANKDIKRWRDQAEQLANYKPWLKVIRGIEKRYRGKKMLPVCPSCDQPFYLEDLNAWMNRELAEKEIKKEKEKEI